MASLDYIQFDAKFVFGMIGLVIGSLLSTNTKFLTYVVLCILIVVFLCQHFRQQLAASYGFNSDSSSDESLDEDEFEDDETERSSSPEIDH